MEIQTTASLRWRVLKSFALLKQGGYILSFKINFFPIPTSKCISLTAELPNKKDFVVEVNRSNLDHLHCEVSRQRLNAISLLVKDPCQSKSIRQVIKSEIKKREFGLLMEKMFGEEVKALLLENQTPIKRIYKSTETEDKQGTDYWLTYKKKLRVPIDVKSTRHAHEHFLEAHNKIPRIYYEPGDPELLKKLERICRNYKKGKVTHK